MQTENRFLDDLARLAGGAFSTFSTLKDETESRILVQIEQILTRMNLVRRDEFESLRETALKAREESINLANRLDTLESTLASNNNSLPRGTPLKREVGGEENLG